MKTCYEGHDAEYRKRLSAGSLGWDVSDDGYEIHQSKLSDILADGRAPSTGKLLELGCGAGNIGLWFAGLGYSVSGIDIAPTAVELAQKRAAESGADASFCIGNVVNLEPFADDTFDFVYDSHLLHCIIGADRAKLFANVGRVLKTGGYFLVDTMCFSELTLEFEHFDLDSKCTIYPDGTATRYIGKEDDIINELESAGFNILSHHRDLDPDGHVLVVEMTTS
jgi:SAM-dependent methyltransferase